MSGVDVDSGSEQSASGLGAASTASLGVGAALAAGVASACCVGPVVAPLVVAVLGAGGAAWAASLKPYSPLLLAASGVALAYAFRAAYASGGRRACRSRDGGRGARKAALIRAVVWGAAVLWVVSVGLNLFLPES